MSISLHTNSLYTNYTSSSNLFDDPQNLQHDPNHKTESDVNVDKLSESASSDSNVVQENPVQTPRTSEQIFGIPDHDFYHHIIESIKLAEGAAATSSPTPQAQPQPVPTKKEILETHPNGTPKTERLTFEDGHQELLRYEGADNSAHPDYKNITQRVKVAADKGSHSVMNYDPQNENLLETKNYVNQKLVSNRTENPAEQSAVTQEFYASGNVKAEHFEKYGFEGRVTKYQDTTEHLKISNTEHNIPSEGYTTITTYDEMTGLPSSAVTRFDDTHRIAARTNFTPDGQKDTTTDYDREGRKTRFGSYDNNGILYLAINYKTVKDRQVPDTVDYYKDNGDWMTRLPADKPAPKDRNNIDPPPKPKPAPSPPY